ncbi:hypothetical protein [Thiocapsa marina]|uniref:hypothetical protein n=1 Tax=Thiocapsa marina TaxID=244573 RepID=UPI0005950F48|nr:hypothetical protein [Thiocapsa marina]
MSSLLLTAICMCFATTAAYAESVQTATQGQFAVELAGKLGHKTTASDSNGAVELLKNLNIVPGLGPDAVWKPSEPATTKFVADIQAAVQMLLKGVALDVGVSPPPTLDLFVFELPPAPQKIVFPAQNKTDRSSSATGIPDRQETVVVDPPTQAGMTPAPMTAPPPAAFSPADLETAVDRKSTGSPTQPK